MVYSTELAYLDYFRNEAEEIDNGPLFENRLKAIGFAAGITFVGVFSILAPLVHLVIEGVKIVFYSLASIFTLGCDGNFERLRDHCKILLLNLASLIAIPFLIAIFSVALMVGIISPMAAYRMMEVGITPLSLITSQEREIWEQYQTPKTYEEITRFLSSKITSLFDNCSVILKLSIHTVINEFSSALDAGFVAPIGYMDSFHSFGANPKCLTDEQKTLTPILLLNGNYSHQGTFLPLLYRLKIANNQRPVYTINLPPNTVEPSVIASKIQEIKDQYQIVNDEPFEIDMIGHSMGSSLMQKILSPLDNEQPLVKIRKAITIGYPFCFRAESNAEEAYDVIGSQDAFVPYESYLPEDHQKIVETGHLGLLFHRESLNAITGWLD